MILYLLLWLVIIDDIATAINSDTPIPVRVDKFNNALKRTNELAHYNNISKTIQELDEAEHDIEMCDMGYCLVLPPKCNRKTACVVRFQASET